MRWMLVVATSALVAGCSWGQDTIPARTPLSVPAKTADSTRADTTTPSTTATTTTISATPVPGTDVAAVIAWIEAGQPVPAAQFTEVTRDGAAGTVEGVAFSTDTVNCISTAAYRDGALACLVDLDNPPPRPPDAISVWKGNWVDFDGANVEIGSVRGDPGPFRDGRGATLPAGDTLTFGDFRCRADTAAVLCVNYADRSGVRLAADGVDGFGCLTAAEAPPGIGVRLAC
ncbi:hypothetical protein [Mycobacterium sp. C31M]